MGEGMIAAAVLLGTFYLAIGGALVFTLALAKMVGGQRIDWLGALLTWLLWPVAAWIMGRDASK